MSADEERQRILDETRAEIVDIRKRIRADSDRLDRLLPYRDRLRRQLADPPSGAGVSNGGKDILVVPADILGDIIQEWADNRAENKIMDLSANSGVNARNIRGIKSGEQRSVNLSTAEKLLKAMGLEHLLGDRLPVDKNPSISAAKIEQRKREQRLEDLTGY